LLLLRNDGRRGIDFRSRRTWLTIAAPIVLASTGPYYFVFTMLLVSAAAGFHALSARTWRPIKSALLVMGIGVMAFAVNVSPSLLNILRHGANTDVAQRSPFETQLYGLKIFQLFIPRENHRIDFLQRATNEMLGRQDIYRSESGQPLGVLLAISLALILIFGVRRLAGRRPDPQAASGDDLLVSRLALLSLVCMLFAASGGFGFLVSAAGLRDIRAWNRISIVIAFLALIGFVLMMDRGATWLQRRWAAHPRRAHAVPAAIAAVVLLVAYVDQGGKDTPPYQALHAEYVSDSEFFASVHDTLGDGAAVFNIPYLAFPEVPPRLLMGAYDEAAGFVFEPSLNWSFGSMRGRVPDYAQVLETQPVKDWMTAIAAIGFTGIVLDGAGYTPDERAQQEAQIAELVGPPSMSANGRYSFFDLRTFAADVRAQLGDEGTKERAAETLELDAPPTTTIAPTGIVN
jgi:phosphoglycerol transferase